MFAALRPLPGPASPPPARRPPRRPTTPVVTQDPATVWPRIQDELRRAVPASSYEIWLAPLHPVALDGDDLVLQVPTALHHWVAERFGRVLQSSVAAVLGPSAGVRLEPGDDDGSRAVDRQDRAARWAPLGGHRGRGARRRRRRTHAEHPRRRAQPEVHLRPVRDRRRPTASPTPPRWPSPSCPGQAYNPLFVYGPPGCRQDPPAPLDRELRPVARRRADRPLRHGRDVHERVRRRAAPGRHRAFQGALPPGRRAPHRRHPVPRAEGEDRGGVLPHLQRAPGHRQPARPDLGPASRGTSTASTTVCASVSRRAS